MRLFGDPITMRVLGYKLTSDRSGYHRVQIAVLLPATTTLKVGNEYKTEISWYVIDRDEVVYAYIGDDREYADRVASHIQKLAMACMTITSDDVTVLRDGKLPLT